MVHFVWHNTYTVIKHALIVINIPLFINLSTCPISAEQKKDPPRAIIHPSDHRARGV